MCINSYVACGSCNARADEHVRQRELRTEVMYYSLDEDGDMGDFDDSDYGESGESESDGYECSACGNSFSELDKNCVDPDCGCEECVPALDNYDDPETYIKLCRTTARGRPNGDSIPELKKLIDNRWLPHLFVTRERAEEIGELDWSEHFYWDFDRQNLGLMETQELTLREEIAA